LSLLLVFLNSLILLLVTVFCLFLILFHAYLFKANLTTFQFTKRQRRQDPSKSRLVKKVKSAAPDPAPKAAKTCFCGWEKKNMVHSNSRVEVKSTEVERAPEDPSLDPKGEEEKLAEVESSGSLARSMTNLILITQGDN